VAREAGVVGAVVALRLDPIETAFADAARALAGNGAAAAAAVVTNAVPDTAGGMSTEDRARIAFTSVLRTPRQVSTFLQSVAQARARAGLSPSVARHLRQRGRVLRRTARFLKHELRAIARGV
jgi:hypothetical protein